MRRTVAFSGVGAVLLAGLALGQIPSGERLNPVIDLLAQGKPVFGVYAPRNPRSRGRAGASAPVAARSPDELAGEAVGYAAADFLFDGSMERGLEAALPAFTAFTAGWQKAGALVREPSLRLTHPLIVKSLSSRPTRPLPSRKGWIVSNWAWASPTASPRSPRGGQPLPGLRHLRVRLRPRAV